MPKGRVVRARCGRQDNRGAKLLVRAVIGRGADGLALISSYKANQSKILPTTQSCAPYQGAFTSHLMALYLASFWHLKSVDEGTGVLHEEDHGSDRRLWLRVVEYGEQRGRACQAPSESVVRYERLGNDKGSGGFWDQGVGRNQSALCSKGLHAQQKNKQEANGESTGKAFLHAISAGMGARMRVFFMSLLPPPAPHPHPPPPEGRGRLLRCT